MSHASTTAPEAAGWRRPDWATPLGLLNALAPRGGFTERLEIGYGPGARHALDAYIPAAPLPGRPVVVFFYGGGWECGERGWYRFVAATLAARGVLVLVPDYRLFPEVRFPAFLADGAGAVGWAREHAAALGGDPARLFLMGHSAGAYIAAMLALQPNWLAARPAGVIGLAGPYDFLPLHTDTLRAIFGPEDTLPATQPINFVTPKAPPMLLATGMRDGIVLARNSARLAARLRAAGVAVTERRYATVGHRTVLGALATPLRGPARLLGAPVLRDCLDFIAATR